MSDLQALAQEFKKWKGSLGHCRYPNHLWDKAHQLKECYSLRTIASTLGVNEHYLKRKFSERDKPITFAPVQIAQTIKIEYKQATVYANPEQLETIIQILMGQR
jgi:AraC-like DNA-binding protein